MFVVRGEERHSYRPDSESLQFNLTFFYTEKLSHIKL